MSIIKVTRNSTGMDGAPFGAKKGKQKTKMSIPRNQNSALITIANDDAYYCSSQTIQGPSAASVVLESLTKWLSVSGISNTIAIRTARNIERMEHVHQITIQFNERSDMATFKLGYSFDCAIDIQYF